MILQNKQNDERSWGSFIRFAHNKKSMVNVLDVKPNSRLSLQHHNNRKEFGFVIGGKGKVQIDDNVLEAKTGNEFSIKTNEKHRIITNNNELKILEISFGEFDENDIVMGEDDYGRN